MAQAILWLEGVNFRWSLFDTSDLSTLRGGSLALLNIGYDFQEWLKTELNDTSVEAVSLGASRAILRLHGDRSAIEQRVKLALARLNTVHPIKDFEEEAKAAIKSGKPTTIRPYNYLQFVHGLSFEPGAKGLDEAQTMARQMQFSHLGISGLTAMSGQRACQMDKTRPADAEIRVASDNAAEESELRHVSAAVAARRHFGRAQRQAFYVERVGEQQARSLGLIGPNNTRFCDSFHDIIANPPGGLPVSAPGKLAVFYADGNKFGKIRKSMMATDAIGGLKAFSEQLTRLQSQLLPHLLGVFRDHFNKPTQNWAYVTDRKGISRMRFETLLWGGDEVRFVMPAWLAIEFAERFFAAVKDWEIEGHKLSFSASLVIASYKTPIRQLINFGESLVDDAKETGEPGQKLVMDVLESIEPPTLGIAAWRADCLGLQAPPASCEFLIGGEVRGAMLQSMRTLKATLPRSQLYSWLQHWSASLAGTKKQDLAAAESRLRHEIELYLHRAGRTLGLDLEQFELPGRTLPISLFLLSQYWDYLDPPKESLVSEKDAPVGEYA